MKTTKTLLTILVILFATIAYGQQPIDKLSYQAYMKGALPLWEKAIKEQSENVLKDGSKEQKLKLATIYYGYLSATLATKSEDAFKGKLDKTKDLLEKLIEENPKWGEPKAVMSSVLGLEMAYSPLKGAYLGMKSSSLMKDAMKESGDSPLVMKLYAGSMQYTPAMWGGDMDEAARYLKNTIAFMESNEMTKENWLYADALANLGIVYQSLKKNSDAKIIYEKALAYEPEFGWVKHSLMPDLVANSK